MTESLSVVRCRTGQRSVTPLLQQKRVSLFSSLTPKCCVIRGLPHLLLTALHSQSSSPRQRILWLSQRHLLLGESHPVTHAVDTCSRSTWRAVTGLLRSLAPFLLFLGSYNAPGFVGGVPRSTRHCLAPILAILARPVHPRWPFWLTMRFVGLVSLPMKSLLDGIPCRIQGYRLLSPLQGLRISRYPGGYAFTVHLGVGLTPTW
jgi:hypothetical protein